MKAAFHFDADLYGGYYGPPIDEEFFRAALALDERRVHARVRVGDLLLHNYVSTEQEMGDQFRRVLNPGYPTWTTIDADGFIESLPSTRVYVVCADGLTPREAWSVDATLRDTGVGYRGALQIISASGPHWVLYEASLLLRFRLVGRELRMLNSPDLDGDRDDGMFEHWKELGLFTEVRWEDIGVEDTIFDPYKTPEFGQRAGRLEILLTDEFMGVVAQSLRRAHDADPRLLDVLYAAVKALREAETDEQYSQAAVSCRRFLAQLADALYPPRAEKVKGKDVDEAHYRNRLWAYAEEKLSGSNSDVAVAQLKDVGDRVERLDALASKGVHADIGFAEARRLLVALTVLAFEFLTWAPPPVRRSSAAYEKDVAAIARHLLGEPDLDEDLDDV